MTPKTRNWLILPALAAMLVGTPALAQHPHGNHAQSQSKQAPLIKTIILDRQSAKLVFTDARTYFNKQHEAHPNHPGIPTHRFDLTMSTGSVPDTGELQITTPAKHVRTYPLWKEGKALKGEVELREKGPYQFRLTLPEGKGSVSFKETL